MDCVSLFAEAGIPSDHSLTSEIGHRISARLLPSAREQADASKLLVTLYPNKRTVQRFLSIPPELFQRLITILTPADDPQFASHEYLDLQQAMRLLSSRVAAHRPEPRGAGAQFSHSIVARVSVLPDRRRHRRSHRRFRPGRRTHRLGALARHRATLPNRDGAGPPAHGERRRQRGADLRPAQDLPPAWRAWSPSSTC